MQPSQLARLHAKCLGEAPQLLHPSSETVYPRVGPQRRIAGSGTSVDQGRLLLAHAREARPLGQNANRAAPCELWPDRARPSDQCLKTFVILGQPPSEPLHNLITQRTVPPDQGRQPGTELKIERLLFAPYRVD